MVDRCSDQLGHCAIRIFSASPRQPNRQHRNEFGAAKNFAGSYRAWRVRAVCGAVYE